MINKEFANLVKDIVCSEEFKKTKKHRHHIRANVYEHSIRVAYLCYLHHKRFGMKINLKEFVRGALLHDYYLYDSHDGSKVHKLHWFSHPQCALDNALKKYPELTEMQQDMIKNHMFPVTLTPPQTFAGWLVCFYDKVAAVSDFFGKNKWKANNELL